LRNENKSPGKDKSCLRGFREDGIKCEEPGVPLGEKNLAYQAALLLLRRAGITKGIEIEIRKNIPLGAGLGGGSSDAASVLKGLNKLWNLNFSKEELLNLGREIGSDVPFFILGGTALGRKRGDLLVPLISFPFWVVLAISSLSISTSSVYQSFFPRGGNYGSELTKESFYTKIMEEAIGERNLEKIGTSLYNSLEKVVKVKYPFIEELKSKFKSAGAIGALMSGSGATVFGLAADRKSAYSIAQKMRKEGKRIEVTRGIGSASLEENPE
jgi:4-diphosphocytidyl-2-C-methyl-D-erythritol kinase